MGEKPDSATKSFGTRVLSGRGILLVGTVVILVAAAVGALWVNETRRRGEADVETYRSLALERNRDELRNLVAVAFGALQDAHTRMLQAGALPGSPREEEAQRQALETLRHLRYGEGDYFWVNDLSQRMLMHPYQTQLQGQDLSDFVDPNGVYLFREFTQVCEAQGAGFVAYSWPKPGRQGPQPKLSYVKLFQPWGWILGTGLYIDDIDQEIATQRGQITRAVHAQVLQIVSFTLAGCLFVAVVTVVLQRRRSVELAVAASELRLRHLFEGAPDGVVLFDADSGRIRSVNSALTRMLGRSTAELVGQPVTRRVREAVAGVAPELRVPGARIPLGSEVLHRPDGSGVYVEDSGTFLEFEGRKTVAAFVRDATDRRHAEEALRHKEQLLTTVLNNTDNSLVVLDETRRVVYYNERYLHSAGVPKELLDAEPPLEDILRHACRTGLYPADQVDEIIARRLQHLESPEPQQSIQTPRQDGVIMEGYSSRLPGGGYLLAFRDVTERAAAERALQEEKEFSDSLVRSSGVATFVLSAEHRVLSWNRACEELTGVAADDMLGTRDHWKAFYAAERPCLADLVLEPGENRDDAPYPVFGPSTLNPEGLHAEGWYDNLGGADRYLVFDAVPLRSQDGRLLAAVETLQDLTDLKRLEEDRGLLATAVEQSVEGIVVTDTQGAVQYVNHAFEVITGYSREDALAQNVPLFPTEQAASPFDQDPWATVQRGDVWKGHLSSTRKDGSVYQEDITISPVRDGGGSVRHFVMVRRDVTHELELEKRLTEAQRLEALGTLSGGIAHEFNNILTSIQGFTELTLDDVPPDSVPRENLEFILSGAERARELVRQILTFSRREEDQDEKIEAVPVAPVVLEALSFLRASIPPTLEMRWNLEPGEYAIMVRPSHLRQMLINLCTNAAQAMEGRSGLLEVTVAAQTVAAATEALSAGAYVHLVVQDTGPGMTPEVLERIFEPFFTTKGVGDGSGMGLAVVHGIVQGLGGSIEVHSRPGAGTRFDLWLPQTETPGSAPDPTPGEASSATPPPRAGKILLVDDEPAVLAVEARLLSALERDIVAEPDGERALARLEDLHAEFALLITDQTLPGLSGLELARQAQALRPGLPVILSTGDLGAVPAQIAGVSLAALLEKPWSRSVLLDTVREVLSLRDAAQVADT